MQALVRRLAYSMPTLMRILHVLRRAPLGLRFQAWAGLVLIIAAAGWVLFTVLWDVLIAMVLFALGAFLVGRAVRDSQRSSSSSP